MKKLSEQQIRILKAASEYGMRKSIDYGWFNCNSSHIYIPTATANSLIKLGLVSVAPDGKCEVTEQGKQYL